MVLDSLERERERERDFPGHVGPFPGLRPFLGPPLGRWILFQLRKLCFSNISPAVDVGLALLSITVTGGWERGGGGGRRERAPRPLFHRTLVGPWISNQSLMKSVVAAGIYGHRSDPKVSTRAASNVPTTCNRICNFLFYRVKIRSNEIFNIIPPNRKRLDKFLRKQCDIARRDKMNALLAFFSLLCGRTRTRTWGGGD